MKHLKRYTIIGIIFVLITGTFAHFLYDWTGKNHTAGLFTPINESVWEHMKLLFFPMFIYSLVMIFKFRRKYSCITSALCFGIIMGTFLIPLFYYAYTSILGRNIFILDFSTFLLSIVIAFWLSYKLTLSCRLESYTSLLCIMVCILFVCFLAFTYYPPDITVFQDPTTSKAESRIVPCTFLCADKLVSGVLELFMRKFKHDPLLNHINKPSSNHISITDRGLI